MESVSLFLSVVLIEDPPQENGAQPNQYSSISPPASPVDREEPFSTYFEEKVAIPSDVSQVPCSSHSRPHTHGKPTLKNIWPGILIQLRICSVPVLHLSWTSSSHSSDDNAPVFPPLRYLVFVNYGPLRDLVSWWASLTWIQETSSLTSSLELKLALRWQLWSFECVFFLVFFLV